MPDGTPDRKPARSAPPTSPPATESPTRRATPEAAAPLAIEFKDASVRLVAPEAANVSGCSDCWDGTTVVVVVIEWRSAPQSTSFTPLCGLCFAWRVCAQKKHWLAKSQDPALDVARVLLREAPGGVVQVPSPKQVKPSGSASRTSSVAGSRRGSGRC
jgi:hypothetical protein